MTPHDQDQKNTFDRRDLLMGTAAISAGLPFGAGKALAADEREAPILASGKPWKIAFEEHFITPTFNDLPSGISAEGVPQVYRDLLEVGDERIALMDEAAA